MQFHSPEFLLLFLPVFMLGYFISPAASRLYLGIAGSLVFYAWGQPQYLALMVAISLFAYGIGRLVHRWRVQPSGTLLIWAGAAAMVGLVVWARLVWRDSYPLGLSYVAFQVIAYLIEVRRGIAAPETHLGRFAFYILLFPKIPVGPIVRYSQVAAQIKILQPTPLDAAEGLRRFIRGLAKKVLIADPLGRVVDPIFALSSPLVAPHIAWMVLISYALQIFFDFSGYADMAIGMGRMLGLRFMENFNFPYLCTSIADFWRRWHISLSTWFRDFVFYPLERHRLPWIGQQLNTLAVFVLVGLWHGFTRNLLVWGAFHGIALAFESTSLGRRLQNLWLPLRHIYALSIVLVGWVFFRSTSLGYAAKFLARLAGDARGLRPLPFTATSPLPLIEPTFVLALAAGVILSLPVAKWIGRAIGGRSQLQPQVIIPLQLVFDASMVLLLTLSMASIASLTNAPAIYGAF